MKEKGRIRITNYQGKFFYRLIDSFFILLIMYVAIKANQNIVTMAYISVALLGVIFYSYIAESLDIYSGWRTAKLRSLSMHTAFCWTATIACLTLLGYFSKTGIEFSRLVMGSWFTGVFVALIGWRVLAFATIHYMHKNGLHTRKAVIIGMTAQGQELSANLIHNPELGIVMQGFYDDRAPSRLDDGAPSLVQLMMR